MAIKAKAGQIITVKTNIIITDGDGETHEVMEEIPSGYCDVDVEGTLGNNSPEVKKYTDERMLKIISAGSFKCPDQINMCGFYDFIRDERPDVLIMGGDCLNDCFLTQISAKKHPETADNFHKVLGHYKFAVDEFNDILDTIDNLLPKSTRKFWLTGEVEQLISRIRDKVDVKHKAIFDLEVLLQLEDRGYEIVPFDGFITIGKLRFRYTNWKTVYHARTAGNSNFHNTMLLGNSTEQVFTTFGNDNPNEKKQIKSVGCMCNIAPRPVTTKTRHKFAFLNGFNLSFVQNGDEHYFLDHRGEIGFNSYNITMVNGQFVYNGKRYGGRAA